jgi:hypothetical protein
MAVVYGVAIKVLLVGGWHGLFEESGNKHHLKIW